MKKSSLSIRSPKNKSPHSGTEIRHLLRKKDFPVCCQEGLHYIEKLGDGSSQVSKANNHKMISEIVDEFIFYQAEKRGAATKKLNKLQELQLIDILSDYFSNCQEEVTRNTVFMYLFHPGQSNDSSKVKILSKLVSYSISTANKNVLLCCGIWLQQQGCASKNSLAIIQATVEDFIFVLPNSFHFLLDVPDLSLHFTGNFLSGLTSLYSYLGDGKSMKPPDELIKTISHWVTKYPKLCTTPLLYQIQNVLPKGSIAMPATSPLGGLMKWCIESALVTNDEGPDSLNAVFSKLHLGLLEILLHNSKSEPPLILVNTKQIVTTTKEILDHVKCNTDLDSNGLSVSLDRLAKFILVLTETNCCSGNLEEVWSVLAHLPQNKLLQMTIANKVS